MAKKDAGKLLTSADDILAAAAVREEVWYCPALAARVPLRSLNAHEQNQHNRAQMLVVEDDDGSFRVRPNLDADRDVDLVARGVRNGEGPILTAAQVREMRPDAVRQIADRLREISGMDERTEKAAEGN